MQKKVRILLAEDDAGHASLIKKNLRRAGIQNKIHHFKDGDSLLKYIYGLKKNINNSHLAILLLLDIRMPKRSGIEVLKKLKGDKVLKDIFIIIVTTSDDPLEIRYCYEIGCNAYITKPVIYEKFRDTFYNLGVFLLNMDIPLKYLDDK